MLVEAGLFDVFKQYLDEVADLWLRLVFIPFIPWDVTLALVPDINQHKLAVNAKNLAFDNRIDGQ